jgi:hypothetical protein
MGFGGDMVDLAVASCGNDIEQALVVLTSERLGGAADVTPAAVGEGKKSELVRCQAIGGLEVQVRCGDLTMVRPCKLLVITITSNYR